MLSFARTIGFLALVGAVWSSLFAGAAHVDVLLLSGTFLLGTSMIAEAARRPKTPCPTLEIGARLAALGAEHDGLAVRLKIVEAGVRRDVEDRMHDIGDAAGLKSRSREVGADMQSGRENVIRLFGDTPS